MTITKMVCIDPVQNKQKFWHGEVLPNGDLQVSWGRVGAKASHKIHPFGNTAAAQQKLNTLIQEKRGKGYTYAAEEATGEPLQFSDLSIGPDILEMIESLESWLAPWQNHIDIKFDRQTGQLVSPLGNIDRQRLREAQQTLDRVERQQDNPAWFAISAGEYLEQIPLRSKGALNLQALLGSVQAIRQQAEYLDLLARCLELIWDMRKLIMAEIENPAIAVADKAQWIDWGGADEATTMPPAAIDDGRMAAIEW